MVEEYVGNQPVAIEKENNLRKFVDIQVMSRMSFSR